MKDTQEHLLTTREASDRLGVAIRELYRLIDVGDLVAYKAGRELKLRVEDVDAYRHRPAP